MIQMGMIYHINHWRETPQEPPFMAEQKVWVGSVGPMLYDDDELISDEDGDLAGSSYAGISTTGQMTVMSAPTLDNHVLRNSDVTGAAHLTLTEALVPLTVNGYASAATVNCNYTKLGRMVTIVVDAITGTSNVNTFNFTGIPTLIRPAAVIIFTLAGIDNGVSKIIVGLLGAGGSITFQSTVGSNTSWNPAGNKGVYSFAFSYLKV